MTFGGVNGNQTLTVVDKGFSGTVSATSNDTTIVTVTPAAVLVSTVANPASTGTFSLKSIGIGANKSGSTTITITDGTVTIAVPVTVSETNGTITYWPATLVRLNG